MRSSASSAEAAWPPSTWRTISGTTGRWRSRCSTPIWPRRLGRRPVPARDPAGRPAPASPHPDRARLGRDPGPGRAPPVVHHALHPEGESLRDRLDRESAAAGRGRAPDRPRGGRRAGVRAPGKGSSTATSSRRTSCSPARRRWWPTSASPGRWGERRREADRDRACGGDAGLHEPGAGERPARAGRADRRLRPGRGALRDAGRGAAVHRAHGAGDPGAPRGGSGPAASNGTDHDSRGHRAGGGAGARQGAIRPIRLRGGVRCGTLPSSRHPSRHPTVSRPGFGAAPCWPRWLRPSR